MLGLAQTQTLTPASQRLLAPWPASRHSSLDNRRRPILIASRPILKIALNPSQQTRKHFLIAFFSAISASARRDGQSSLPAAAGLCSAVLDQGAAKSFKPSLM